MSKTAAPIALITGAAQRIGRHLALHLAREGWDIVVHYNSSHSEAETLAEEIKATGQRAITLQADLSDSKMVNEMIPNGAEQLGIPNLLINNASLFEKDQFGALSAHSFDMHMAINLRAPLLLAEALAKSYADKTSQTEPGNIINITDQRIFNPGADFVSYTLSKIGLGAATRTMAKALAPTLRVNAIAPGPVLKSKHQTDEDFISECSGTPLGHGTTPEEICSAVSYILSARAMTGETIALDGGQRLDCR
ncbi:MAG: short chain dehydrogenase [Rhodomicrobium sp.]|nr:MAG: short chain dehydrogenase [Rhodomicrobium sp.]